MALTLYLLRHAKSGWDNPNLQDVDRPLSDRGRRETRWLAELLRTRGISPSRILCSAAQRTRETLAGVVPALSREASIDITRRLYEAPAERLLSVLREQLPTDDSVMLIGHNPGLEDFAGMLAGAGHRLTIASLRDKYPPAGLAQFEFDARRWGDIATGAGQLVAFMTPPRDAD